MNSHRQFTLCTLCLGFEKELLYAFDYNASDITLPVVIRELLQFEVSEGGTIPWMICTNCVEKLKDFSEFKKQANKSMNFLQIMLVGRRENRNKNLGDGLPTCVATEQDVIGQAPPEEEDWSNRDGNCSNGGGHCSDVHTSESVMHVKREDVEKEVPPAEEYLSTNSEKSSFGEMQCSDVHGSASEVPLSEELMDQDDLHLYLSSDSSDQTSDAEDHSANITGPETEVTNLSFGDVTRVTVFGGGESVGYREETSEGEKDLKGLKDPEHCISARLKHGAKMPVATSSHSKQRRLRSNCRNYGPDEDIESTPCGTSGKLIGEENGEHIQIKGNLKRERRHGNGALAGNILIGSSVGDGKSEGQDFMCDDCGKVFRSKDLIESHVKVPCGRELIDCGNSNKKLHSRNDYRRHKSLQCGSNISRRRVQSCVAVDEIGESAGKRQIEKRNPPTCHVCSKEFSTEGHLNRHIKTVHFKERNFSCEICGKGFGEKGKLQTHMRSHSGVKPYTYNHCEKGFTQSVTLRTHIRAVHEMEKPYTCGECGKAFSHKHDLKKHMIVHTGERPHTCGICSRSFSQKQNLERHMLIHTGEKPHTCGICRKAFRRKDTLMNHMATHASKVPHPCNLCTKSFAFRSALQRHLAEHRREEND